jgi:hypothetical protein
MVEQAHRGHLTGGGFKPPKGAVVKSHGIEHLFCLTKISHIMFASEFAGAEKIRIPVFEDGNCAIP